VGLALIHFAALLVFGQSTAGLITANAIVIGTAVVIVELFSRFGIVRITVQARSARSQRSRRTTDQ